MTTPLTPGVTIHFLRPKIVTVATGGYPDGQSMKRGDTLTLTAEIIEYSRDRNGNSWLDTAEESGIIGIGPWPGGETWSAPGSADWDDQRAVAIANAYSLPLAEREKALADVRKRFGIVPTSTTINAKNF